MSLKPLNSETYNSSFTVMNYAPADKSGLTSLEFVEFNSSVTLSQQYAILGKVAKEIGKVYEKSGNETLAQLAKGYYIMEEESKGLSKLVEKQLQEYNRIILKSSAVLLDQDVWACLSAIITCLLSIATIPQILSACYLCVQIITCIPACFTIFGILWCVLCITAGIIGCLWCAHLIVAFPYCCYVAGQCLGLW